MDAGYNMACAQQEQMIRDDITVEQNIDRKIAYHKQAIKELEQSKATMGPLLNMRICDIRSAMQY